MIVMHRNLPPTKTHAVRYYYLTAPAVNANGSPVLCRVNIVQRPKSTSRKADDNTYLVEQVEDDSLPRGWQSFIFSNMTAEPTQDRPGVYQVNVDQHGQPVYCGCTGSKCQRQSGPCKHKDCVRDLTQNPIDDEEGRLY